MKTRIDFLIVGAEKSGTTSLHRYLGQHPGVFTPFEKELAYFSLEPDAERGRIIDTYYAAAKPGQILGLSQVNMLLLPGVAERIHSYNPQAKILAILRNPIERAYSAYWFARMRGWERMESFESALQKELTGDTTQDGLRYKYLERGHYAEQLQRYLAVFGQRQVKVLFMEDLHEAPSGQVGHVLEWLGVSPRLDGIAFHDRHNVTSRPRFPRLASVLQAASAPTRLAVRTVVSQQGRRWIQRNLLKPLVNWSRIPFSPPPMKDETRAWLQDYYEDHNKRLAQLLDRELSHWQ